MGAELETVGDLEGLEEIAAQRTIRVNQLSRRVGFGWSVSPAIERAAVKRETAPTKPIATSLPPPPSAPAPSTAGIMMLEPITSYTEALGPIRERVGTVLKIRYADFDDLCGFAPGLTGKVLGAAQVKRFGIEKFFDAIRGAGLRIRFEEDPEQTARMLERIAKNYEPRQANQARPNNTSHPSNKAIDDVLNYLANKRGGLTRLRGAVKQARSNWARHAAMAREKKRRCGIADFAAYLANVSRHSSVAALPPPEQKPCSAEANAA